MSSPSDVAPATANPWTRPVRGARGPVPNHSRAGIAAAGVELADAQGLDNVTMRAIARSLGMGAPSLYRYVKSREEIVELMADLAIGAPPEGLPSGDWTESILRLANTQLLRHQEHGWLVRAALGSTNLGPNTLEWFEAYLLAMAKLEMPARTKMEVIALVTGLVSLFAQQHQRAEASPPGFDLLSPENHPHLAAALTAPEGAPEARGLFDRAVLALCAGLGGNSPLPGQAH